MTTEFLAGTSAVIRALSEDVDLATQLSAPVLIRGESGCGKQNLARFIHDRSFQSHRAFTPIRCAESGEIPLESLTRGTIFLDEIGALNGRMQEGLLKFLESSCFRDASPTAPTRARVIAATRHHLIQRVHAKTFRKDLYYRVNILYLQVPPLRDRPGDIPVLLNHFFECLSALHQRPVQLEAAAQAALMEYRWPGNVRELRSVAELLILESRTRRIHLTDLPVEILREHGQVAHTPAGKIRPPWMSAPR